MPRLRVAGIDFLNPAPLMWNFDHEPGRTLLAERYAVETMMPSECAARLEAGRADLGLVPLATCATLPGLRIAPGCVIASKGAIRSIVLVVHGGVSLENIRTVAADTSSRASLAYMQVLLQRFWKADARVFQHAPDLESMLTVADAALLIGDPALLAVEDRERRQARTGKALQYIDLGTAWKEATGHVWVSAVWAVRAEALNGDHSFAKQLAADLIASRDAGLAQRDALVREWATRIPVPESTIHAYLHNNIHYVLDEDCLAGMRFFFHLAAECGILPAAPPLRMLEI